MSLVLQRIPRTAAALLIIATVAGCATHGSAQQRTAEALNRGDITGAITAAEKSLDAKQDLLLRYLELGLLHHLNGDYGASNSHLDEADRLAEALYTRELSALVAVAFTNPRLGPYRGARFERAYIHYYKTLNFLLLAVTEPDARDTHLQSARVEARRVDILLGATASEEGGYGEVQKENLATHMLRVASRIASNVPDRDALLYREDAWLRYLTGVVYEVRGEYDHARVAYQTAAELYEAGFAKQFELGGAMGARAWFDAIRVSRASGSGKWRALADQKLTAALREELDSWFEPLPEGGERPRGQVLVIQHLGRAPEKRELDLLLNVSPSNHELYIAPVIHGSPSERRDQLGWFHATHADTDILELLYNYQRRGIEGLLESPVSKRIPLGPLWESARKLGLDSAVGPEGTRLTLPYYPPLEPDHGRSEIKVDEGVTVEFWPAASPALCAVQEQMANAGRDLGLALTRELLKEGTLHRLTGKSTDPWVRLARKLVSAGFSAAETRSWLSLPAEIRLRRIPADPGVHRIDITTWSSRGGPDRQTYEVEVVPGDIAILRTRFVGGRTLR